MQTIAIVGVGRVGLPLALVFAEAGLKVFGVDVDQAKIDLVNSGTFPFMEAGAQALLEKHLNTNFFMTSDVSTINQVDAIILTLGTPVDEHLNPMYSQLQKALTALVPHFRAGQLIVLRSTVAPGTTEYVKEFIERRTTLNCGSDLSLAFCPERIAQGKAIEETRNLPQIIGGINERSSAMAKELFSKICDQCHITTPKSAELAKIFTNMYRYINFAIGNEFMILAQEHGQDIHHIIDLVNNGYKRGGVKLPGFAAGPCLYKDGFFLVDALPFNELISVSWKINETLPLYLLNKIKAEMSLKDKRCAILGMAFKADNDDIRNSLSFKIKKALEREHADMVLHDPFIDEFKHDVGDAVRDADLIVLAMNHSPYKELSVARLKEAAKPGAMVCDVWNMLGTGKVLIKLDEC